MKLRPYQKKALTLLWGWFEKNTGNVCISMPTGSGKSHIIAGICQDAIAMHPPTQILMLTHVKELIEQDAAKLKQHWPNAPLGIYSAGIGKREIGEPITFAGIQSIRNQEVGHIDLVIIDECHLVSHKAEGMYRTFLSRIKETNPKAKVIGLSATPFRLGHGLITDKPAIFNDIIEPVTIGELQEQKYLAILKSKATHKKLSADGVHKRGGEYIESELQAVVNTKDNNEQVLQEVIKIAGERKHWLFFCAGVDHAERVRDILIDSGVTADCVTGKTQQRDKILDEFKSGQIKALTNANVLTTGFDYPDIDLIVMMRPTLSPGLYTQMAGRGLRLKTHTDHCLVLDFAGVVEMHGPITSIAIPRKPGEGIAPSKICPVCDEIVHLSKMLCECGYEFPKNEKDPLRLHDDDIQGDGVKVMEVTKWMWEVRESKKTGIEMAVVTYFGVLSDHPISEYILLKHPGFAGMKALETLRSIASKSKADYMSAETLDDLCFEMESSEPPTEVGWKTEGRYPRVVKRIWGEKKHTFFDDNDVIF